MKFIMVRRNKQDTIEKGVGFTIYKETSVSLPDLSDFILEETREVGDKGDVMEVYRPKEWDNE